MNYFFFLFKRFCKKNSVKLIVSIILLLMLNVNAAYACQTINEGWQFVKTPGNKTVIPTFENAEKVHLPHTWNMADVWDDVKGYYRDAAWYRKSILVADSLKNKKIFLFFEGANQEAAVYVNGQKAGEHKGGYTAFRVDITNLVDFGKSNRIDVMVDNSYSTEIAPISGDFSMMGGIYRDVYLEVSEKIHFDKMNYAGQGVFVKSFLDGANAGFQIDANIVNSSGKTQKLMLRTRITDRKGKIISAQISKSINLKNAMQQNVKQLFAIPDYQLWSPDNPYLYTVECEILDAKTKTVLDTYCVRPGIRTIAKDEKGNILLNGKVIKLIGVNRHQDFDGLSNALPNAIHRRDVEIIKEIGANFLRTSHYPHDPAIYDACDELGILVWSEISVVNQIGMNEHFEQNTLNNMKEMILQHFNHPSVVFWGFMNEVLLADHTFPKNERENLYNKTRELAQKLNDVAKSLDNTRLTTIAHHGDFEKYEKAGLNNITDVCGYNLYFGWYVNGFGGFDDFVDNFKQKYPTKPLIISEYGAGSNKGIYARLPRRFDNSMQWAEKLHEIYLDKIIRNPKIAGSSLWNFADFSSEGRKDTDPHMNNKGLLYYDRTPKDVFYLYKAKLQNEPALKIAAGKWLKRPVEVPVEARTFTDTIKIYSNCQQVTLQLNGKTVGNFQPDSICRIFAPLNFVNGKNQLVAIGRSTNGKTITDVVNFDYHFIPFPLNNNSFRELCVNVGGHFDYVDTKSNEVWMPDRPFRPGGWGYVGGEEFKIWKGQRTGGERVIYNTINDPLYQTQRVGLTEYRFDVAAGWYEVELLFAELQSAKELKDAFLNNLGNETKTELLKDGRIFNVSINNQLVLSELNLLESVGENTAANFTFRVKAADNGVVVKFDKIRSETVLNGIKIRKF